MRYRLTQSIVASRKGFSDSESRRLALPAGAILRMPVDIPLRGLIEVEWEGQVVEVFVEDVRSRGWLVEVADSE